MTIETSGQIGQTVANFFGAALIDLPNPLVYANYAAMGDAASRRSMLSRNAPLRAKVPPLNLVRYPAGTLVNGDRSYLTVAGEAIVGEQVAPWCADPAAEAAGMRASQAVDVAAPCVLLARYGEATWGHWLAEMLLKAAVVERAHPGRFLYAVPWWSTEATDQRSYATAVLESLAAFGVPPDRLVRLAGFTVYRFAALHDITGTGGDMIHPGALACLRGLKLPARAGARQARVAMLRRPPLARAVFNADDVRDFLALENFALADLTKIPFIEQARLFAEADIVVGSLGSDFAGALFAPEEARLVSVAPAEWADGYFIRLFQRIGAVHADIRGPSTRLGDNTLNAPHIADPLAIAEGIAAVLRPVADEAEVDGECLARRLGRLHLELGFGSTAKNAAEVSGAWSPPEPNHRWSLGPASDFSIPRTKFPAAGGAWLEIEGQGHVYPPVLATRPLSVRVNGQVIGRFDVIGRTRLFCRVPEAALEGSDPVKIEFLHPVCPSPCAMGAGEDFRPLGFGFETLRIFARAGP
jgi:hypothetical protein